MSITRMPALLAGIVNVFRFTGFLLAVLTVLLVFSLPADARHHSHDREDDDGDELPFSELAIRIEVNETDGDAGLQIFFDAEAWKKVEVENPRGREIYVVTNYGKLRRLGSTEHFMESEEPNFEEMPLPDILRLLPAGEYEFSGLTVEGDELEGTAELTHDLPCGPEIIFPEEDQELDPKDPVVIAWEPVTNKLDNNTGECGDSTDIVIVAYEVIVDIEESDPPQSYDIFLPADAMSVAVPPEFIVPGAEYSFEILAIEESGNQTISESAFTTSE